MRIRQPPVSERNGRLSYPFSAVYLNVKKYAGSNQVRQRKESTNAYRDSNDERGDLPFFLRVIIIVLCAERFLKAHPEKQEGESFLQTVHACYYDEKYLGFQQKFDKHLWGVSTGPDYNLDHIEMTINFESW